MSETKEFQKSVARTMRDLPYAEHLCNAAMGLSGEAGEVVDILKKHLFHGRILDVRHLREEMGDTLFYIAAVCNRLNIDIADVMQENTAKLLKRYPSGFSKEAAEARADKG